MPPAPGVLKCLAMSDSNSVARLRAGERDMLAGGDQWQQCSKWSLVLCPTSRTQVIICHLITDDGLGLGPGTKLLSWSLTTR